MPAYTTTSWNELRDLIMRLTQECLDREFPPFDGAINVNSETDGVLFKESTDDFCIRGITHDHDFGKFLTDTISAIRKIIESPDFNGYRVARVSVLNILSEQSNPDGGTVLFRVIGYNNKAPIKVAA